MKPTRWNWKSPAVPLEGASILAWRFEAGLLERYLSLAPAGSPSRPARATARGRRDLGHQVELLARLADLYARLGQIHDSLRIDQRLVDLRPKDPTFHYNLACSYSRLERVDEALAALCRAVSLGYDNVGQVLGDSDLDNLRGDPRFQELLAKMQQPERSRDG